MELQATLVSVRSQLQSKQTEVDTLRQQVSSGQQELDTLRQHLTDTRKEKRAGGQGEEKRVPAHSSRVIPIASRRARAATGQAEDAVLEAQIRALLATSPELSRRAIAAQVQCSPTTASKWKSIIQQEGHFITGQRGQ